MPLCIFTYGLDHAALYIQIKYAWHHEINLKVRRPGKPMQCWGWWPYSLWVCWACDLRKVLNPLFDLGSRFYVGLFQSFCVFIYVFFIYLFIYSFIYLYITVYIYICYFSSVVSFPILSIGFIQCLARGIGHVFFEVHGFQKPKYIPCWLHAGCCTIYLIYYILIIYIYIYYACQLASWWTNYATKVVVISHCFSFSSCWIAPCPRRCWMTGLWPRRQKEPASPKSVDAWCVNSLEILGW